MANIHLIGGEKGGVGKSLVARVLAQYLIDHGAKIEVWNTKNKTGWTPLRISDGVVRGGGTIRSSPPMSAELRKVMSAAGVSTEVEPDIVRAGHPVN